MSARTPTTLPVASRSVSASSRPGPASGSQRHDARDLGMGRGCGEHAIGVAGGVRGLDEHDPIDAERGTLGRQVVEPEVVVECRELGRDPAVVTGVALPDVGVRVDDSGHAEASCQYRPSGKLNSSIEVARISAL